MTDDQLPALADSTQDTDSLLQLARNLWRARWFAVLLGVIAAIFSGVYSSRQPRYLTTGLLRLTSPFVTYGHRNFWEIVGRTRLAQFRTIAPVSGDGWITTARLEPDPWLVRVEIRHAQSLVGEKLLQEWFAAFQTKVEHGSPDETSPTLTTKSLTQLQQTLTELDRELGTQLPAISDMNGSSMTVATTPMLQVTNTGDRIPVVLVPYYQWYQQLLEGVSRFGRLTASSTAVAGDSQRIFSLAERACRDLQAAHLSLDVSHFTGTESRVVVEGIREEPIARMPDILATVMGFLCGLLASVLVVNPVFWLIEHRNMITAPSNTSPQLLTQNARRS